MAVQVVVEIMKAITLMQTLVVVAAQITQAVVMALVDK
jgi:hypothetical protein